MLVFFTAIFAVRCFWAWYGPIMDCDETFNYWEPLHYMSYHYGLQTWEYSPEFALRSYAYAGFHNMLFQNLIPFSKFFLTWIFLIAPGYQEWFDFDILDEKVIQFHLFRVLLGLFSSICEAYFCWKIEKRYGSHTSYIAFISLLISSGFSHTTVSFLPTSTILSFNLLIIGLYLDIKSDNENIVSIKSIISNPKQSIFHRSEIIHFLHRNVDISLLDIKFKTDAYELSKMFDFEKVIKQLNNKISKSYQLIYALITLSCFIWPYVGISYLLVGLELLTFFGFLRFLKLSIINFVLFVVLPSIIDLNYLGVGLSDFNDLKVLNKVPIWNQIKYNVISNDSTLYGSESGTYYLKNLFVNFNILLVFSILSISLLLSYFFFFSKSEIKNKKEKGQRDRERRLFGEEHIALEDKVFDMNTINYNIIEESVMLNLNYLFVLGFFSLLPHKEERFLTQIYPLIIFSSSLALSILIKMKFKVFKLLAYGAIMFTLLLSASRNQSLVTNLTAPYTIFGLANYQISQNINVRFMKDNVTLCMGSDWYLYPSSFYVSSPLKDILNEGNKRQTKVAWIESDYNGLLPQPYKEYPDGFTKSEGRFNNKNRKEKSSLSKVDQCSLIIAVDRQNDGLVKFTKDGEFETVACSRLLDLDKSTAIYRSFYNFFDIFKDKYQYTDLCLLNHKDFKVVT